MFVVLIALVSGGVALHFIQPRNPGVDRQDAVSRSLGAAQEALIAYAAVAARPGELPCPDRNNDGVEDPPCDTPALRIGRIPWATLGIEDPWLNRGTGGLTDNSGETLWYAVSNTFRPGSATPMNADSVGDLVVNNAAGLPMMTNVVAVLIAPGPPLAGQSREMAAQNTAANYLEDENTDPPFATFVVRPVSDTFNDVVRPITHDALMRAVTARVAKAASAALQAYFKSGSPPFYFPRARAYGEADCEPALTQGQLDMPPIIGPCEVTYKPWPTDSFPTWFTVNEWDKFVHYAVTPDCSDVTGTCTSTAGTIVVTGIPTPVPAVVIVTGRALSPPRATVIQARPCAIAADCLDDPRNADGSSPFARPDAASNDRLEVVPIP